MVLRRLSLVLLVAVTILALVTSGFPAAAKPLAGSNRVSAKACQKGGYAGLAPKEDRFTAFTTEEACTSYAAQGGEIGPLVVPTPTLTPVPTGCATLNDGALDGEYLYKTLSGLHFKVGDFVAISASGGSAVGFRAYFSDGVTSDSGSLQVPGTRSFTINSTNSWEIGWTSTNSFDLVWDVSCVPAS
jgi:hypothetical protein